MACAPTSGVVVALTPHTIELGENRREKRVDLRSCLAGRKERTSVGFESHGWISREAKVNKSSRLSEEVCHGVNITGRSRGLRNNGYADSVDDGHRIGLHGERGDDGVCRTATATQSVKEIRVAVTVDCDNSARGKYYLSFEEIINAEAVLVGKGAVGHHR